MIIFDELDNLYMCRVELIRAYFRGGLTDYVAIV